MRPNRFHLLKNGRGTCALLLLISLFTHVMASSHVVYFGTYTRTTSRGIYVARLDDETGRLSAPQLAAETPNPTWITFDRDRKRLYAAHPSKAQAVGYAIRDGGDGLTPLPLPSGAQEKAGGSCHLAVDATNRVLVSANYGDGYVAALAIDPEGKLGAPRVVQHTGHGPNPQRQDKPHVHSVTVSPDNRHVLVCDLGLDRIFTYRLDPATATLTPATPPFAEAQPCSGPRHFKFGPGGRHAYVLTEMGATIEVYDYEPEQGRLTRKQIISTLPPDFQAKWGAELRVHPNGRFLYASNRGHDSLAVFAVDPSAGTLTLVEIVPSGGKVPRNFDLSPNGRWLVCAHQESGNVTVFAVDKETGRLQQTAHSIEIAQAVCVLFYD